MLIDEPAEGAWNMALDEALLLEAGESNIATLRFYRWRVPTLSLGYFQPHSQRQEHAASRDCALVRRASGGGAILHDRELTYSIALPGSHRLAKQPELLYRAAHETLIAALAKFNIKATQFSPVHPLTPSPVQSQPFLCFQRRATGDVLIGAAKIGGSAQRRHGSAVLQHGSVLLAASDYAPELPGIAELTGQQVDLDQLRKVWQPLLLGRLELPIGDESVPPAVVGSARTIAASKFAAAEWTNRR